VLDRLLAPETRLRIPFQTDRGPIAVETQVVWTEEAAGAASRGPSSSRASRHRSGEGHIGSSVARADGRYESGRALATPLPRLTSRDDAGTHHPSSK